MKVLLFVFFVLVSYVVHATTITRSVMAYYTPALLGRTIGSQAVGDALCLSHRPNNSAIAASTPRALLCRSNFDVADMTSVNLTVPVIWYTNNITMASTYSALWTLQQGSIWYILTAVTGVLGSVGQNQTYWTGCSERGVYIDEDSSCGGNWTINSTANVGLTGTNDGRWMNSSRAGCYLTRPMLCVTDSYITPIPFAFNSDGATPAVIGGVIGAIVVMAMFLSIGLGYNSFTRVDNDYESVFDSRKSSMRQKSGLLNEKGEKGGA